MLHWRCRGVGAWFSRDSLIRAEAEAVTSKKQVSSTAARLRDEKKVRRTLRRPSVHAYLFVL